jgi:hypothetical protein
MKLMPRKCVVKVVLSKQQREILDELAVRLGISESEALRMALMDYAKETDLIRQRIQRTGFSLATQREGNQNNVSAHPTD